MFNRLSPFIVLLIISTLLIGSCSQPQVDSRNESQLIAEEFVRLETTFKFDGIPETLKVTSTTSLGNGWQFTIEFDSRHTGYGNRSGQVLAEVITHHTAVVIVQSSRVETAIIDDRWDMLLQQEFSNPISPTYVPVIPNDSIVTAKIIDLINVPHDSIWEITIEIKTSEDVPGLANITKSMIEEIITVKTNDDLSRLEKGQIIIAHVELKGDEWTRFYYASEIKLSE